MKSNKNKISFLVSLCIHIILILAISPFIVKNLYETENNLSLSIFKVETKEPVKKRKMLEHQSVKPKIRTASGSPSLSQAAPKYTPEMNPSKAQIYDNVAPEIVTFANIPQTDSYSLPNSSLGKDNDAAGPVVIPEFRGSGGDKTGIGRDGSGTGKGGGFGKGLVGVADVEGLGSIGDDFGKTDLGTFISDVMPGHGFVGQLYVPGSTIRQMPDFKRLKPIYTFATANIDVPKRNFTQGFPTPDKQEVLENFAILFRAKLAINKPGVYEFMLNSDDGSKLYINGKLVVDNDGVHATISRRSHIRLNAGFHPIEIHYFQGPRHAIALQWFYKPPNGSRRIVPPSVIFHPDDSDVPDALKKIKQRLKNTSK